MADNFRFFQRGKATRYCFNLLSYHVNCSFFTNLCTSGASMLIVAKILTVKKTI